LWWRGVFGPMEVMEGPKVEVALAAASTSRLIKCN
jgi:hypothetical protein